MDRNHRTVDYVSILFMLIFTSLIGLAGLHDGAHWYGIPILLLSMIICFVIHWLIFIPSFFLRSEKYYDLTGTIAYLTCTYITLYLTVQSGKDISLRSYFMISFITIWTLRLGLFLFQRIKKDGEDKRFENIRTSFSRFLFAWTLSAVWVFITSANALTMITINDPFFGDIYFYLGTGLWLFGFTVEVISDEQKKRFRADPLNNGKFIKSGLWSISRHPNYFGEITLWFGIACISFPILHGWQFVTLISPIFVYLLLTKVSGINMLESRADEKWGTNEEYQRYKRETPVLLPFT